MSNLLQLQGDAHDLSVLLENWEWTPEEVGDVALVQVEIGRLNKRLKGLLTLVDLEEHGFHYP